MNGPLVSVIMLAYNREKYIRESIESVLAQTYGHLELIVMDDGSDDNTRAIVESIVDPRIRYFFARHSSFGSRMRNFCVGQSRGELIALIDSDDVWLPDKLKTQVDLLEQNPASGFAFCDVVEFTDGGTIRRRGMYAGRDRVGKIFDDYVNNRLVIYPTTIVFRRSCYDAVGPFNEDFHWTDNEFFHRLAYSYPACLSARRDARIRKHDNNLSTVHAYRTIEDLIPMLRSFYEKKMISRTTFRRLTAHYHYLTGLIFLEMDQPSDAQAEFRKCIGARPWHWRGWWRWTQGLTR